MGRLRALSPVLADGAVCLRLLLADWDLDAHTLFIGNDTVCPPNCFSLLM